MKQQNKIFVIDRFEEAFAVLENTETLEIIEINKEILPKNIAEGTCLFIDENGNWQADTIETMRRSERIKQKQADIFK